MDLHRAVTAAVIIFLCYCILALHYQSDDDSNNGDITTFPLTNFDNTFEKQGRKFWDSILPQFQCPPDYLARIGNTGDGGKWTCGLVHLGWISENSEDYQCLLYSFGVSGDSTFEAEVLKNTRCSVYAYDPTVNQIAQPLNSSNPRVYFHKLGVGGEDKGNLKTLRTMMQDNGGHLWIDILKMDVEGSEYPSLGKILEDFEDIPFGQLLVEFHVIKWDNETKEKIVELINDLEYNGLRMFYKEVNNLHPDTCSEFSFINVKSLDMFMDKDTIKKMEETRN